jgi:hypothetical protein
MCSVMIVCEISGSDGGDYEYEHILGYSTV